MTDTKHGWVTPRADGARARCGGPGVCATCDTEAMHEKMLTGLFGASVEAETAPVAPKITPIPAGWKPIESVPENEGRPIFCLLAFGPEGDQSVGKGFRVNGKWYVGATFYCLGQEKSYEIREIEVQPTHWRSIPNLPGEESDTPPATTQDDPITVSLDPDPRGVSVGVWQGSHCIYNGAHAVPAPAAGDALDRDQQRLALWQAIRDITIGNLHDDKLILANLHKAGYVIALAAQVPQQGEA